MEALAEIFAGRLHIDEQRDVVAVRHPVRVADLDPGMARHGDDVRLGIGRSADRGGQSDRVEERFAGEDLRRAQVLIGHVDDALAGLVGHLRALAIRSGDRRLAGQRHAERLRDRVHRRGRAHRVAMAGRRRAVAGAAHELLLVDLACAEQPSRAPDHRARADQLAVVPAVEHRPAVEGDRRDVDGRRGHDRGRRGLVAAGGEHHRVDRIAVQDLDQPEIGEVAVERRGRPPAILEDRVHREFHRNPAGVANARLDPLRPARGGCGCTARGPNRTGRCRRSALPERNSSRRESVVHEALDVERCHVAAARRREPLARPKRTDGGTSHRSSLRAQLVGRGAAKR